MEKIQLIGEKNGVKRNLLTNENGLPLSIVVSAANEHDVTKLVEMIEGRIVTPPPEIKEKLCLNAEYTGENHKKSVEERNIIPHIRPRGEKISEKEKNPDFKPRKWIVEVAHSWFIANQL